MKIAKCLFAALVCFLLCTACAEELSFEAESAIAVYSISGEKKLRACGE